MLRNLIADRVGGKEFFDRKVEYKFEKIKRAKRLALERDSSVRLIDLGVGEPDLPASEAAVRTLAAEAGRPHNRFYADNGITEFKAAAVAFLQRNFHIATALANENVLHCIGSKSALSMLPLALVNPGDVVITTTPGYPILATHSRFLGAEVYPLRLVPENGFLPKFDDIPEEVLQRAKVLYLNYPNNPTGAGATLDFYKKVVDFAQRNQIFVVVDAAYANLAFKDQNRVSILGVDGALDCACEIHSLSKSFNMTGWRLGFTVGSTEFIDLLSNVKDNCDSGQFIPIQRAGVAALADDSIWKQNLQRYERRIDKLVDVLRHARFDVHKPAGGFFCYVAAPRSALGGKIVFTTAEQASTFLIENAGVVTVPWDEAGPYLRFSVTYESALISEEDAIMQDLQARLTKMDLAF